MTYRLELRCFVVEGSFYRGRNFSWQECIINVFRNFRKFDEVTVFWGQIWLLMEALPTSTNKKKKPAVIDGKFIVSGNEVKKELSNSWPFGVRMPRMIVRMELVHSKLSNNSAYLTFNASMVVYVSKQTYLCLNWWISRCHNGSSLTNVDEVMVCQKIQMGFENFVAVRVYTAV